MKITAHRGNSDSTPENTISAIKSAIREGADWAEIDVQETKDGELVVFHDSNLRRVTGVDKHIWEISGHDLEKLDAGCWFSAQFLGEKVPKLKEIIEVARGKIKLNIELKLNGHQQELAFRVVKILQASSFIKQCVVTSFDLATIEKVKDLDETISTGIIIKELENYLFKLPVEIYAIDYSVVSRNFVQKAHDLNKEVHVWTVDTEADMHKMIQFGVDNIITNKPKTLKKMLINSKL